MSTQDFFIDPCDQGTFTILPLNLASSFANLGDSFRSLTVGYTETTRFTIPSGLMAALDVSPATRLTGEACAESNGNIVFADPDICSYATGGLTLKLVGLTNAEASLSECSIITLPKWRITDVPGFGNAGGVCDAISVIIPGGQSSELSLTNTGLATVSVFAGSNDLSSALLTLVDNEKFVDGEGFRLGAGICEGATPAFVIANNPNQCNIGYVVDDTSSVTYDDNDPILLTTFTAALMREDISSTLTGLRTETCLIARQNNQACYDCGEFEVFPPEVARTTDSCGVCDGDNESCRDCTRALFGTAQYDVCDVCNGDGNSCRDCTGTIDGTRVYDACDVCGGADECLDCEGVPFGTSRVDACGVCCGDNDCIDCANVIDGSAFIDQCGECIVGDQPFNVCLPCKLSQRDECGVCNGDSSSCADCNGVPNGPANADVCGICGGDGLSCVDCRGILLGTSALDVCGVCDGDGLSCTDCASTVDGTLVYDLCGICGGDNDCVDCAGEICGLAQFDLCGVCDGDDSTCVDCEGVVNGPKRLNRCNQCVDYASSVDAPQCLEEQLIGEVHHSIKQFAAIVLGVLALLAVCIACVVHALGGTGVLGLFFGCCIGCGGEFLGSAKCRIDKAHAKTKRTARRTPCVEEPAECDAQTLPSITIGEAATGGGGGGGSTSLAQLLVPMTVIALCCTPVVQAQAATGSASVFRAGLCAGSIALAGTPLCNLIQQPSACLALDTALGVSIGECYAGTDIVSRFDTTLLAASLASGTLSGATVDQLVHASKVKFAAGGSWTLERAPAQLLSATSFVAVDVAFLQNDVETLLESLAIGTSLTELRVEQSNLIGNVGDILCSPTLAGLKVLSLRKNSVAGTLCSALPASLEILDLRANSLVGTIPSLSGQAALSELYLDNNRFSGVSGAGVGMFNNAWLPESLRLLCIASAFTESLAFSWNPATTPALESLIADGNDFTGPFPSTLFASTVTLAELGLSFNLFTGEIPSSYFSGPLAFSTFRVNGNEQLSFPPGAFSVDVMCGPCNFECTKICNTVAGRAVIPQIAAWNCAFSVVQDVCANECANTDCADCAGVNSGSAVYDACDVCNGDGDTCSDCAGTINGLETYDVCDVCGGSGDSCLDCAGVANGASVYDGCDVCDGDNSTCDDCLGAPNGSAVIDACDVCGGDNSTCSDCLGEIGGPARYNELGNCNETDIEPQTLFEKQLRQDTGSGSSVTLIVFVFAAALCFCISMMRLCVTTSSNLSTSRISKSQRRSTSEC